MGVVMLLVLCVVTTIAMIEIAKRFGHDVTAVKFQLFASSLIPVLFIALWIYGIWWIQSENCTNPNTCDAPGMLLMSFSTLGGAVFSFVACLIVSAAWNHWFIKK